MKQFILNLFLSICLYSVAFAQAPSVFNYQGIARNAAGVPYANQSINVKISVRSGVPAGALEYSETRGVLTNAFGLFNLQIGSSGATINYGSFTNINWQSGAKFLQTEISVNGQAFAEIGTTQIMSVPYALHSREAKELVLPFSKTIAAVGDMLQINNTDFNVTSSAIKATIGAGRAFSGVATTGVGGHFLSTDGDALYAYSANKMGLRAISNSTTGYGVFASNINSGYALGVSGNLRIFGGNTNPGAGKVLTSDANGNATWQPIASSVAPIGYVVNNPAQGGLQNMPNDVRYKMHAANEDYDGSNNYNMPSQSPSSTFTATVAGMHRFQAKLQINSANNTLLNSAYIYLVVQRGAVKTDIEGTYLTESQRYAVLEVDHSVNLNPGDRVWVEVLSRTENGTNPIVTKLYMSGYRIK